MLQKKHPGYSVEKGWEGSERLWPWSRAKKSGIVAWMREDGNGDSISMKGLLIDLQRLDKEGHINTSPWRGREPGINMYPLLYLKWKARTALVVQWLRIHLPVQETQLWSLVLEDSTYGEAAKPASPRASAPQEKPLKWEAYGLQLESNPHSLQLEKAHMQQWRPSAPKNK